MFAGGWKGDKVVVKSCLTCCRMSPIPFLMICWLLGSTKTDCRIGRPTHVLPLPVCVQPFRGFPLWDNQVRVIRVSGQTYMVYGYVDAQNSFGALIWTEYTGVVQQTAEDEWTLQEFAWGSD